MASDSYVHQGKPKYAMRLVRKAWGSAPHPDLAAAFARIAPDETPTDRINRFRTLTNMHRDHAETKLLEAELQIAAEDFPAARKALGDIVDTDPTARSLTIMAAIERGSGADDAVVKGWLARALTASRGPQWVCGKCHKSHTEWQPVCDNCAGFDTLAWSRPTETTSAMVTGAEMLPLIVGQIEDTSDIVADDADDKPDVDEIEEMPPTEPQIENEIFEGVAEAESSTIANADAPPPDYEIVQPDETEGGPESKKGTT
jgi:HemY protein